MCNTTAPPRNRLAARACPVISPMMVGSSSTARPTIFSAILRASTSAASLAAARSALAAARAETSSSDTSAKTASRSTTAGSRLATRPWADVEEGKRLAAFTMWPMGCSLSFRFLAADHGQVHPDLHRERFAVDQDGGFAVVVPTKGASRKLALVSDELGGADGDLHRFGFVQELCVRNGAR